MFKTTRLDGGGLVYSFEDHFGEECQLTFYANNGAKVDLDTTGCGDMTFSREQAIAIANLILEQTK